MLATRHAVDVVDWALMVVVGGQNSVGEIQGVAAALV
jgi:hypothetical protein